MNILYKGNNGDEREAGHHREEKTTMVWPRQKDARGENTTIKYGMDTRGEAKKRTSKKNVDERSTSSHDSKKFRTRSMENREEWRLVSGGRRQLLQNRMDNHHISVMELDHMLARSGLTCPEFS
jgi:hypothetical protein